MKLVLCVTALIVGQGCRGEWDVPKTPRQDPCTKKVSEAYVYVMPPCMRQPPPY